MRTEAAINQSGIAHTIVKAAKNRWSLTSPSVPLQHHTSGSMKARSPAMRTAILTLAVTLTASAAEIPQGSHALLRLVNSISTRTAREGDYVYFRTATPIAAHDAIVVP